VALERLNEARLSLGEHRELCGELEDLVDSHPLRETLWAQLMLALYRSGRQAEALKAYQRLREHLVEDLGIEPSRELVELEAAVLRHDSTLDIPMAPSATASSRRFANTASAS
jgi:DNA-binding SARP family transcriptional activator